MSDIPQNELELEGYVNEIQAECDKHVESLEAEIKLKVMAMEAITQRVIDLEAQLASRPGIPRAAVEALITRFEEHSRSKANDPPFDSGVATGFGVAASNVAMLLLATPAATPADGDCQYCNGAGCKACDARHLAPCATPACASCAGLRAAISRVDSAYLVAMRDGKHGPKELRDAVIAAGTLAHKEADNETES